MKHFIKIVCISMILFSCSGNRQTRDANSCADKKKYELVKVDSYGFRRAYHGHDTLSGRDLALFMKRTPEPNEDYTTIEDHHLYSDLVKVGIILDGNLNLTQVDTLSNQFDYQISQNNSFKVETRLLEDPSEVDSPSYELTFQNSNEVVLIDTLEFGFPPDVTFFVTDLNNDGKQELSTIYRWYSMNGDNFDLNIYELK